MACLNSASLDLTYSETITDKSKLQGCIKLETGEELYDQKGTNLVLEFLLHIYKLCNHT